MKYGVLDKYAYWSVSFVYHNFEIFCVQLNRLQPSGGTLVVLFILLLIIARCGVGEVNYASVTPERTKVRILNPSVTLLAYDDSLSSGSSADMIHCKFMRSYFFPIFMIVVLDRWFGGGQAVSIRFFQPKSREFELFRRRSIFSIFSPLFATVSH